MYLSLPISSLKKIWWVVALLTQECRKYLLTHWMNLSISNTELNWKHCSSISIDFVFTPNSLKYPEISLPNSPSPFSSKAISSPLASPSQSAKASSQSVCTSEFILKRQQISMSLTSLRYCCLREWVMSKQSARLVSSSQQRPISQLLSLILPTILGKSSCLPSSQMSFFCISLIMVEIWEFSEKMQARMQASHLSWGLGKMWKQVMRRGVSLMSQLVKKQCSRSLVLILPTCSYCRVSLLSWQSRREYISAFRYSQYSLLLSSQPFPNTFLKSVQAKSAQSYRSSSSTPPTYTSLMSWIHRTSSNSFSLSLGVQESATSSKYSLISSIFLRGTTSLQSCSQSETSTSLQTSSLRKCLNSVKMVGQLKKMAF